MKKHVSRLLQPGVIWYSIVLLAFSAAAAALDQFYLAGAELLVTACPLCKYNLAKADASRPVVYFTELLAEAMGLKEVAE